MNLRLSGVRLFVIVLVLLVVVAGFVVLMLLTATKHLRHSISVVHICDTTAAVVVMVTTITILLLLLLLILLLLLLLQMERAWAYQPESRCSAEELAMTISSHLVDLTATTDTYADTDGLSPPLGGSLLSSNDCHRSDSAGYGHDENV